MQLFQYQDGYRYNSDSLLLYDFICSFNPKGNVLDIGSGSGILGLLVKRDFSAINLSQIEIQESHYALTCKNSEHNKIDSHIICDDFLNYKFTSSFDFIISNPPFYHSGAQKSENESLKISKHSDSLPFDSFVKKVASLLEFRGSFVFCYDAKQIDSLIAILLKFNLKPNTIKFVHTKKGKDASIVLIHAKKGSKSLCNVLAPLTMYDENESLVEEVVHIYEKSKTESLIWQI